MRPRLVVCWSVVLVTSAAPALAEPDEEIFQVAPAERRSGFSLGIATGLGLASVSGYPNDVAKIGLPEFEARTGLGVSTGFALWLGGALTDWLSVGVGATSGGVEGNGLSGSGASLQVRIESFPLFYRQGAWRDLGISFSAGTGVYSLERGRETVAEGEGTSTVGAGLFFEPWRLWQVATGPQLEYSHQFSRSLAAHTLVIGWRAAFYGGP
jgi:hypothetical protein